MTLEQQVTSLELSKKLKELGVKQESIWYWYHNHHPKWQLRLQTDELGMDWEDNQIVSTFTVAELGEALPREIKKDSIVRHLRFQKTYSPSSTRKGYVWTVSYEFGEEDDIDEWWIFEDYWEANARAKMLIYLLKNKLI